MLGYPSCFYCEAPEMFCRLCETSPDFPPAWREEMVTELFLKAMFEFGVKFTVNTL